MNKHAETNGPRADLATALLARDAAAQRVDELRTSIARVEDERFSARQKLDAAAAREADEAHDRDDVIDRLIAGDTGAAVLERAVDRKEATAAESEIAACTAALAILRAELAGAERSLELRATRVRDAAGAVIAAEALDAVIANTVRLRGELAACEAVLSFLHPYIPRDQAAKVECELVSSDVRGEHPSVDSWRAALAELGRDAAAKLPR